VSLQRLKVNVRQVLPVLSYLLNVATKEKTGKNHAISQNLPQEELNTIAILQYLLCNQSCRNGHAMAQKVTAPAMVQWIAHTLAISKYQQTGKQWIFGDTVQLAVRVLGFLLARCSRLETQLTVHQKTFATILKENLINPVVVVN
jgi:hypothetical protein